MTAWPKRSETRRMGVSLGVGVGVLCVVLALLCLLPVTTAGEIKKNGEPFMYKDALGHYPMPFPGSVSSMGLSGDLRMKMLVGMCSEDKVVRMCRPRRSPLQNDPAPSKRLLAKTAVEDMKKVMVMEMMSNKKTQKKMDEDPMMVAFQNTVIDDGEEETAEDLQEKVKEFLSISGIDVLLPLDCGKHPRMPEDPLGRGKYPWVAALGSHEDGRFHYRCTGVVITNYHILTDADCAFSPNINVVLMNVTDAPHPDAVVNFVAGRRWHPEVKGEEDLLSGNNIGILELALPIQFNDDVQPVCLPGQFETPDPNEREQATIVGFSIVDTSQGRQAGLFRWPDSPTLGAAVCYSAIRVFRGENPDEKTTLDSILTKNHICVDQRFEFVGKSVLLRVDDLTGRVRVLGVGGVANAAKTNPIAYTHVQPHRFWVELVLRKFRDNLLPRRRQG